MTTLGELAELVGGEVVGDASVAIKAVAPIDTAGGGDLTFITNRKYLAQLETTAAAAVLADRPLPRADIAYLVCANPYLAFARILEHLNPAPAQPGVVLEGAHVAADAHLGQRVTVYPGASIASGCVIGDDCVIHANVVLYPGVRVGEGCLLHAGAVVREGCRLGKRVILQPGAVIGSDGFGFAPDGERYHKIPQVGTVELGDDVEIGACSCVDRAVMGVTRIGAGCKIDNLVQIGHNVSVGEHTVMASQTGISGSCVIGRHCTFGGQSAVAGHLKVGDNLTVGGRGGVTGSIEGNQVVSGLPVMPHREWLKAAKTFTHLPQMKKELAALRRQLDALQNLVEKD